MDDSRNVLTQYYAAERQSLVEQATRLLHGDVMTAEDVVQTTFLKLLLFSKTPTLLTPTTLPGLVHHTMRHLILDLWRRRQHRQDYEYQLTCFNSQSTSADHVFSVCSASQITELIEHRIARMDDTVAKVLRMNVIEEKAVSEIAEELQMNYKAAENRLQTGRRQLRNYMKKAI